LEVLVRSTKLRSGFVYVLILVAIVAILWSYRSQAPQVEELAISELAARVKAGGAASDVRNRTERFGKGPDSD
jgi:hypothetical protein